MISDSSISWGQSPYERSGDIYISLLRLFAAAFRCVWILVSRDSKRKKCSIHTVKKMNRGSPAAASIVRLALTERRIFITAPEAGNALSEAEKDKKIDALTEENDELKKKLAEAGADVEVK